MHLSLFKEPGRAIQQQASVMKAIKKGGSERCLKAIRGVASGYSAGWVFLATSLTLPSCLSQRGMTRRKYERVEDYRELTHIIVN